MDSDLLYDNGLKATAEIKKVSDTVWKESYSKINESFYKSRLLFLGVISWTFYEVSKKSIKEKNDANLVLLLMFFLQNANDVLDQILSGKYVLAASAVKQEMEMVARGFDVLKNKTVKEGKLSNIDNYPGGMGKVYGIVNDLAHVSKANFLTSVIGRKSEGENTKADCRPVYRKSMFVSLFMVHFQNCERMANLALNFLEHRGFEDLEKINNTRKEVVKAFGSIAEITKLIKENS